MNSLAALGIRRFGPRPLRPVRPSGRLEGNASSQSSLPAGAYSFIANVGIAGEVGVRANPAALLDAALRSVDQGRLPLARFDASSLIFTATPWSNRAGSDVRASAVIEFTGAGDLHALVRYIARGINAALHGTGSNGAPTDRQLGPEILAAFLSPSTSMSTTANTSQVIRGATLMINRSTPAPAPAPAPAPTPSTTPGQVALAPPQDVPTTPPAPSASPALAPTARPSRTAITHYQSVLYALGWLPTLAEADGVIGSRTTAALRLFQDNYNREQVARAYRFSPRQLTVNGQLDTATQQALENYRAITRWLPEGQINGQASAPSTLPLAPPPAPPAPPTPSPANPPRPSPPANTTSTLVVAPPAPPPVVRSSTTIPEVRPPGTPGTPQVVVARPPAAPAQNAMPWGTILLVAGTVAVGYTGYRYRHEIRAAFDANAPVVRERATEYATETRGAIRRGSKAAARYTDDRLTRYGNT